MDDVPQPGSPADPPRTGPTPPIIVVSASSSHTISSGGITTRTGTRAASAARSQADQDESRQVKRSRNDRGNDDDTGTGVLDFVGYRFDEDEHARAARVHIVPMGDDGGHGRAVSQDYHRRHEAGQYYVRVQMGAKPRHKASCGGQAVAATPRDEMARHGTTDAHGHSGGQLAVVTCTEPKESWMIELQSVETNAQANTSKSPMKWRA